MRTSAIVVSSLLLVGCGGGGGAGPSQTPPPQPSSFTLSGNVTEAAPTATTTLAGATVTITDGPDANLSTVTDGSGHYSLSAKRGGFTVRVTKTGYEDNSLPVTLTANQSLNAQLTPTFNQIHANGSDTVSGGDHCDFDTDGCKAYGLDVYHDGSVDFTLTWTDKDTWLWLELFDDAGNQLSISQSFRSNGLRQHISSTVTKGHRYAIVIVYANGARTTTFNLVSSWPQLQ